MHRHLIALIAALTIGTGTANAQDAADCEDFPSQAAAQAAYQADPSDPAGNDADGDGLACELFAFADPATDTNPVTASGRSGGDRNAAAEGVVQMPRTGVGTVTGNPSWPLAAASAAALAAAGLGALVLRGSGPTPLPATTRATPRTGKRPLFAQAPSGPQFGGTLALRFLCSKSRLTSAGYRCPESLIDAV